MKTETWRYYSLVLHVVRNTQAELAFAYPARARDGKYPSRGGLWLTLAQSDYDLAPNLATIDELVARGRRKSRIMRLFSEHVLARRGLSYGHARGEVTGPRLHIEHEGLCFHHALQLLLARQSMHWPSYVVTTAVPARRCIPRGRRVACYGVDYGYSIYLDVGHFLLVDSVRSLCSNLA